MSNLTIVTHTLDNTSYCVCDICDEKDNCKAECWSFKRYVAGITESVRKANLMLFEQVGVIRENFQGTNKKTPDVDMARHCKKVAQIDIETGEVIKIFKTQKLAAEVVNISAASIARCARGGRKTAGGFKWERVND